MEEEKKARNGEKESCKWHPEAIMVHALVVAVEHHIDYNGKQTE